MPEGDQDQRGVAVAVALTRRLREGRRLTVRTSHTTINGGRVVVSFIPRYELLREAGLGVVPSVLSSVRQPEAREGTRMDIRFWGTRGSLA